MVNFVRTDVLEYEAGKVKILKAESKPAPPKYLTYRVTDYSNVLIKLNDKIL